MCLCRRSADAEMQVALQSWVSSIGRVQSFLTHREGERGSRWSPRHMVVEP